MNISADKPFSFMRLINFLFIISLQLVISCSNYTTHVTYSTSTITHNGILDTSKMAEDTNNLQVNKIDTFKYSGLKFLDSTIDEKRNAYIDTFTVDNCNFRFINPVADRNDLDIIIYLEKLIDNKWFYTGFTVGFMNHVDDYHHNRDVNGDGFVDITQDERFVQAVYFYDPKTKTYPNTTDLHDPETNYINPDWELIDTARKIFCDFQDFKQLCHNIHSILYTYDGFGRHNLYDLELYNCTDTGTGTHFITKLILSKITERKYYDFRMMDGRDSLIDSKDIPLQTPIDLDKNYDNNDYFDYVSFWKERYKKLLGYDK